MNDTKNPGVPRPKLSDILNGGTDALRNAWNSADAADDFKLLPRGEYVAHIISGQLTNSSSKGTPGYKLAFKVIEGEHAGRMFWHDIWLTPAAMSMAKRDLGKLGVTSLEQLESPLSPGIRCKVKLVIHTADNGNEYNRVKSFDVLGIDKAEADPFAPTDDDAPAGDSGNYAPSMFPPSGPREGLPDAH
ncbi:MAG: DUF669 domain-containing protein [Phycisphaerales bacterium]|nr:DUF669 domain-containing protein [Phycisphaerales bacterium]